MKINLFGKSKSGFTLVEILIVLAILAIVATAAIPIITGQTGRGYKKEAIDQLSAARSAMMAYYQTQTTAPSTYTGATYAAIGFSPGSTAGGQVSHFTYAAPAVAAQTFTITATCTTGTYSGSTVTISEAGTIAGTFP